MSFECDCPDCTAACRIKPGHFLPDEIEPLAARMGVSVQELFNTRLAVDRIGETLVISPALVGQRPGALLPSINLGTCTFYRDGKCEIHSLGKPHECRVATHFLGSPQQNIVEAWLPHQERIRDALG